MDTIHSLPTEVVLMISNHLPFKSYVQFSQTCQLLQHVLTSSNAIRYMNQRFKFEKDSGSLLLFTYYNIIHIPQVMRDLVLDHFLSCPQGDMSYMIRGWSLIHAIHCLDPGRFMTLLLADENNKPAQTVALVIQHQRIQQQQEFAKKIIDGIIKAQIHYKHKICKSKTYQSVFKNLVLSGDLRTVENCLRNLGSPIDTITLSDANYNNRFPIARKGNRRCTRVVICSMTPLEEICRECLYLDYDDEQMRSITETLLSKYGVKVNTALSVHVDRLEDHHHAREFLDNRVNRLRRSARFISRRSFLVQ